MSVLLILFFIHWQNSLQKPVLYYLGHAMIEIVLTFTFIFLKDKLFLFKEKIEKNASDQII